MNLQLFTIGHSNHEQAYFIDLLRQHGITAICDVRSAPYSQFNPQFNREDLHRRLAAAAIEYVFLGKELGARTDDPDCYRNGRVQYDSLAKTEAFQKGLDRVEKGAAKYRLSLMCAEKEPLDCHRTILVARHLVERGANVQHIHENGQLEGHGEALTRLAKTLNLRVDEGDLFRSLEDFWMEAYLLQEERIAYVRDSTLLPPNPQSAKGTAASGY